MTGAVAVMPLPYYAKEFGEQFDPSDLGVHRANGPGCRTLGVVGIVGLVL